MEWVGSLVAASVLILLVIPMVVAMGSVFLLGAAGWAFVGSPSVARAAFYCAFSRRWVTTGFLTRPGSEHPTDVVSCSQFTDDRAITCGKGCMKLAVAGWTASCMEPRYALLSGDVAYRPVEGAPR
jgi:hypothetical protein